MAESPTEPTTEAEWEASLTEPVVEAAGEPTEGEGTQPDAPEAEAAAQPEADADALEEAGTEGAAKAEAEQPKEPAGKQEPEEPKAEAATEPAATTDGKAPEPEPEIVWEDFSLRADKSEIKLTGAKASDAEIRIPRSTWQKEVQPHLADRSAIERQRRQLEARVREVQQERSQAEVEAKAVLEHFKGVLELPQEELFEWAQRTHASKDALLAKVENAALKHRLERAESVTNEQRQAQQQQELQTVATDMLGRAVDTVLGADEFKDLGIPADEFYDRLTALGAQNLFFYPDDEFVRENPGWHVRPGELAIDWRVIAREAGHHARIYRERKEAARLVAEAERANKTKLREAKKAVSPTVRAGGTPVPGKSEAAVPTSLAEWEESLRG